MEDKKKEIKKKSLVIKLKELFTKKNPNRQKMEDLGMKKNPLEPRK